MRVDEADNNQATHQHEEDLSPYKDIESIDRISAIDIRSAEGERAGYDEKWDEEALQKLLDEAWNLASEDSSLIEDYDEEDVWPQSA